MLYPVEHPGGLRVYRSPLLADLDVPHGFSTRRGGVSPPPVDSLNLVDAGDSPDNVAENYRRLLAAVGCAGRTLTTVRQVHGAACAAAPVTPGVEADAIISADPGTVLSIRVADCVPILLADRRGRAVGAVHAGWRGVIAGVVPQAIAALQQRHDVKPDELVAAVGPCISVAHFEVGPEVARAFEHAGLGEAIDPHRGSRPHIDMAAAVRMQLVAAGVPASAIDGTDRCTYRDADEFFSHRRDRGVTGRMAAVIAVPG